MRTTSHLTLRGGLAATLLGLLVALQAPATPAGAATGTAATSTTSVSSTARTTEAYRMSSRFDAQILYWTNVARRQHGKAPLRLMSCLEGYATRWTWRMAASDWLRHQSLSTVRRTCHRREVAENIAWASGGPTARSIVRMWLRSSSHRHNLLNGGYRWIGIGAFRSADTGRVYATQDFGR